MNIIVNIVTLLTALLGIIIGAFLQYFFTKRAESIKQYQNLKTQAYVDFIKAIAGISVSQKLKQHEEEFEFTALLADAKGRVTIYGSKKVVESMASFFSNYAHLNSPDSMNSLAS